MTELRTDRLHLRRALPGDLADLHAILRDPVAMRYWSSLPHATLDETHVWLDAMIAASPDESDDFVIEHAGRVIGKAGCYRLPDIGYILHPDAWGRGFATEALAAVIAHLFARHPIDRLNADVDPRNAGSIALLTKLGFARSGFAERTWLIGDEWCDSVYFSLVRP